MWKLFNRFGCHSHAHELRLIEMAETFPFEIISCRQYFVRAQQINFIIKNFLVSHRTYLTMSYKLLEPTPLAGQKFELEIVCDLKIRRAWKKSVARTKWVETIFHRTWENDYYVLMITFRKSVELSKNWRKCSVGKWRYVFCHCHVFSYIQSSSFRRHSRMGKMERKTKSNLLSSCWVPSSSREGSYALTWYYIRSYTTIILFLSFGCIFCGFSLFKVPHFAWTEKKISSTELPTMLQALQSDTKFIRDCSFTVYSLHPTPIQCS